MDYSNKFQKMLDFAEEKKLYAGSGNPNAKILIIGKELAFNPKNHNQTKYEIYDNIPNWKKNIANHITQQDIPDWKDEYWEELDWKKLNPLYLYKHSTYNEGHTWNKYQKLMDYIREVAPKKKTDFQEFAFLTEYNQHPSKNSNQQDKNEQKKSIKERDKFFKDTDFFQNFPIVIVAAGPYAGSQFDVKLAETFQVTWDGHLREVQASGLIQIKDYKDVKPRQWISLHRSSTKLVIHTTQLSGPINNKLLQEIAKQVRDFAKEKHIELFENISDK